VTVFDPTRLLFAVMAVVVLESLFFGYLAHAVLSSMGRGGWYTGSEPGEHVLYRGLHGVNYASFHFELPNVVMVSNRRLVVRVGWSRAVLADAAVREIIEFTDGRWWWFQPIVKVEFREGVEERSVVILTSASRQARLMDALRALTAAP
jgi:hypothetical protein